jgi:hypothetical protein
LRPSGTLAYTRRNDCNRTPRATTRYGCPAVGGTGVAVIAGAGASIACMILVAVAMGEVALGSAIVEIGV